MSRSQLLSALNRAICKGQKEEARRILELILEGATS